MDIYRYIHTYIHTCLCTMNNQRTTSPLKIGLDVIQSPPLRRTHLQASSAACTLITAIVQTIPCLCCGHMHKYMYKELISLLVLILLNLILMQLHVAILYSRHCVFIRVVTVVPSRQHVLPFCNLHTVCHLPKT